MVTIAKMFPEIMAERSLTHFAEGYVSKGMESARFVVKAKGVSEKLRAKLRQALAPFVAGKKAEGDKDDDAMVAAVVAVLQEMTTIKKHEADIAADPFANLAAIAKSSSAKDIVAAVDEHPALGERCTLQARGTEETQGFRDRAELMRVIDRATELWRTKDPSLSREQAQMKMLEERPDFYKAYKTWGDVA